MRRALTRAVEEMADVLQNAILIVEVVLFIVLWAIILGLIVAALFGVYHLVVWAA